MTTEEINVAYNRYYRFSRFVFLPALPLVFLLAAKVHFLFGFALVPMGIIDHLLCSRWIKAMELETQRRRTLNLWKE